MSPGDQQTNTAMVAWHEADIGGPSLQKKLLPPVILQARRENLPKPLATLGRDLGLIHQLALPVHETCV